MQGGQSEMSTHGEKNLWTRVKHEELIIFTVLESTSIKYGGGYLTTGLEILEFWKDIISQNQKNINDAHKKPTW